MMGQIRDVLEDLEEGELELSLAGAERGEKIGLIWGKGTRMP